MQGLNLIHQGFYLLVPKAECVMLLYLDLGPANCIILIFIYMFIRENVKEKKLIKCLLVSQKYWDFKFTFVYPGKSVAGLYLHEHVL